MRIILAASGRWKSGKQTTPERILYDHYASRIRFSLELREIEEKKNIDKKMLKKRESDLLFSQVPDGAVIVALDQTGKPIKSIEFARKLENWRDQGTKCVVFMIGGPDGLDELVKKRAQFIMSLGNLTWPHLLVRGMLIEQIFRAECILSGHPYHRE